MVQYNKFYYSVLSLYNNKTINYFIYLHYIFIMNPYSIALVGESCSGKSSIIKSFLTKTPTLIPNTGTEAGATTITLKNNKQV